MSVAELVHRLPELPTGLSRGTWGAFVPLAALGAVALCLVCACRRRIDGSRRFAGGVLAATLLCAAALSVALLDGGNDWGGDFAEYIAQARSLCEGTVPLQVARNSYIIANSPPLTGDNAYPWGTPLLLAPFYAAFGKNLFFLKLPMCLAFVGALFFLNRLFRVHFSAFQAQLLTLMVAANPIYASAVNTPLSDLPFLCCAAFSLLCLEKLFSSGRKQLRYGIALGIGSFLSCLVRTNGIVFPCVLLAMHGLWLLSRTERAGKLLQAAGFGGFARPEPVAHAAPYVVFLLLSAWERSCLPHGTAHVACLGLATPASVWANCRYYFFLPTGFFPDGGRLLHALALPFFLYGFLRHFLRKPVLSAYLCASMGILLLWPARQGFRFLFPVMPAMLVFAGAGIRDCLAKMRAARAARAALLLEVSLLLLSEMHLAMRAARNLDGYRVAHDDCGAYSREAREMYAFVGTYTPEDAKIVFFKPRVLYLETGRLGFRTRDPGRLREADYLLLAADDTAGDSIGSEIETNPPPGMPSLEKAYENPRFKLYRILPAEPVAGEGTLPAGDGAW